MGTLASITDPFTRLIPRRNELGAPLGNVNELGDALPAQVLPPDAIAPPTARDLTMQRISGDQSQLNKLRTDGPGVNRIGNPVVRALGKIGDVALSAVAPRLASFTPGTTLNNNRLQDQQQGRLTADLGADKEQAGTELLNAQPALKQAALENQTLKTQGNIQHQQDMLDATQQHNQQTYLTNLQRGGRTIDETDPSGQKTRVLRYEEMSEQQQAVADLAHAHEEQADATAALKKAQNDPTSPAFRLAKQRADAASQNANTAIARLSRQDRGLDMRREMMNANLYGTGADGQALTGAAQIMGEDGQQHTVGLRAASTAIKQQKGVGTFNDLVGSVDTSRKALESLHSSGGSFADAKMIAAMQDPHSMVGKYVNGQLVKGNLDDKQIEALGAVNQLREQIGILRASTGGTAAEAQAQRMLDTLPTAGDSPAIVRNKLKQIDGVLQRLSPSVTGVHGGLSVGARPASKAAADPLGIR